LYDHLGRKEGHQLTLSYGFHSLSLDAVFSSVVVNELKPSGHQPALH
jgi:hypothetical protein